MRNRDLPSLAELGSDLTYVSMPRRIASLAAPFGWCVGDLALLDTLDTVVNTHPHEDHTGNNDLLTELTRARVLAHRDGLPDIRFPPRVPWYRSFLFGPGQVVEAEELPDALRTRRFRFDVVHTPGHCPGHVCLFETSNRWLFSGDLYVAPDLDTQLADVHGPAWIESLERALGLRPTALLDGHGIVVLGESEVRRDLELKRDFLIEIRRRVRDAAQRARSLQEIVREAFDRRSLADHLSFNDGWLSMITGSDFSRGNLARSFLREPLPPDPGSPESGWACWAQVMADMLGRPGPPTTRRRGLRAPPPRGRRLRAPEATGGSAPASD